MSLILNIETSARVCSAVLAKDGQPVSVRESGDDRQHSKVLAPFIKEILDEKSLDVQDLDAVAVSMGPGSYTGLRIGVSTAKGLCYGGNVPLLGISTLKVLASGFREAHPELSGSYYICPMIDARRMEVYTCLFDNNLNEVRQTSALIIDGCPFPEIKDPVWFIGDGAEKCKDLLSSDNYHSDPDVTLSARFMCHLSEEAFHAGAFRDVAYFEPFYLKDFIATTPKNKILGDR